MGFTHIKSDKNVGIDGKFLKIDNLVLKLITVEHVLKAADDILNKAASLPQVSNTD